MIRLTRREENVSAGEEEKENHEQERSEDPCFAKLSR